ncbi:hypothetical protein, partial [Paraburkholderia azotifigens]
MMHAVDGYLLSPYRFRHAINGNSTATGAASAAPASNAQFAATSVPQKNKAPQLRRPVLLHVHIRLTSNSVQADKPALEPVNNARTDAHHA